MADKKLNPQRVINGSFGEVWINGSQLSQCKKLSAKVEIKKEDVPIPGTLKTGKKMTGYEGKGSMTLFKISSLIQNEMVNNLKSGILPTMSVVSSIKDPAAFGAERVKLTGVTFDDITLIDWEVGKLGELELPFTFEDYYMLDIIDETKFSASGSISVGGIDLGGSI